MVEFTKNNIKTGAGTEDGVVVGPVQNKMQFDKVKDMYGQVEKQKWKPALTGSITSSTNGYFITPAITDNPPEGSRILQEEPFGPIVPLLKWSDKDNVIDRANALKTGLGASVWRKGLIRAEAMAWRLEAGNVWVNSHSDVDAGVPFEGWKESGVGMEWGMEGLKSYTNSRNLWIWKKIFE
ncbi:hypothetical protein G6011_09448 [Alternaria panax]|uniref:aldehyde dehydrogenase (NAD(+)) n=1 Tax=Alternaria panax TaxID=48097 RepID=A0AAD4IB25_9PLEO|nr:hypothetical protein G6011_09448 [Alternaria panax]